MSKRIYNILFHTHTVSGIVISVGLYVIFFAGSFSFFRDEIVSWERNQPMQAHTFVDVDLNTMMDTLNQKYDTYSRDISFTRYYEEKRITVNLSAPKDTTKAGRGSFFYMDPGSFKTFSYANNYSIGEFLYRLHFFAPLNFYGRSGYLLAGVISFFFLFAIVTGFLVHWKKIVSNFYLFRPRATLKNVWTDAHTALGIIGLPYQFVYAVTGVFLIAGTMLMSPVVLSVVYDGDSVKMYEDLGLGVKEYPLAMVKQESPADINGFVERTKAYWPDFKIKTVSLYNYGDANMHVAVMGHPTFSTNFTGEGELVFKAATGEIVSSKDPFNHTSYLDGARGVMDRLHFGDFGGVALKIIYFILGIISCFVIISGILIWLVARDKKTIAPKKRKFNAWLGWIYLAVCLSMFPATAFTFLAVKLFVSEFDADRMAAIYHIFFYSWLAMIVLFTIKRDNFFTNKYTLIIGSALGFLVPLANGIVSGNWIWKTFQDRHYDIFLVDTFWLVLSTIAFVVATGLKRKDKSVRKIKVKPEKADAERPILKQVNSKI